MTREDFCRYLMEMRKHMPANPTPVTSLLMDEKGTAVELLLDQTRATYSEWIPGEGSDIGLIRDQETNRVIGVRLPMLHKELVTSRIEAKSTSERSANRLCTKCGGRGTNLKILQACGWDESCGRCGGSGYEKKDNE